jgi:hypothetical protein
MTNRELLNMPKTVLGEIDKQRLFLLRVEGTRQPCPVCRKPINLFEAASIDIDQYDFGKTEYTCRCPHCAAELEQVVPALSLGPMWFWQLKEAWLQDQLSKARAWERQQKPA